LRVDEPANSVMAGDQPIAVQHLLSRYGLRVSETITNDFKNQMMGWQCEHHHHYSLVAGRVAENVMGSLQSSCEIPIALGLTLPNAAQSFAG
jgi:hypothetical protein